MKIPTSQEFLENFPRSKCLKEENSAQGIIEILDVMQEFAKLHVKAALEAALDDAPWGSSTDIPTYKEMVDAILNAYPETNIK